MYTSYTPNSVNLSKYKTLQQYSYDLKVIKIKNYATPPPQVDNNPKCKDYYFAVNYSLREFRKFLPSRKPFAL